MNTDVASGVALASAIASGADVLSGVDIIVGPPFVSLAAVRAAVAGSGFAIAAQNHATPTTAERSPANSRPQCWPISAITQSSAIRNVVSFSAKLTSR